MGNAPTIARAPTRVALLGRSGLLAVLGLVFWRVLVLNPHDNAYLAPATAGELLLALAIPFIAAALLPDGKARRIGAWVAVALVWLFGGLAASVFVFYAVMLVGASLAAGHFPWSGVTVVHLVGTLLLVPIVLGISRRLFR